MNRQVVGCWLQLGLNQGQVFEYDAETLAPLGIVVNQRTMGTRHVFVVANGTALVLVDQDQRNFEVVHPNADGSYWRKYQRNKRIWQEEKAREAVAARWFQRQQTY